MHEINLLPQLRRATLRREVILFSIARFLSNIGLGLGLITACGLVVMAVLWIFMISLTQSATTQLSEQVTHYQVLRDHIAQKNDFISRVDAYERSRVVWTDFLEQFLAVVPPGVTITTMGANLKFNEMVFEEANFTFSGQAIARSTLTVLVDRLRSLPGVTQVESPSSNLIQRDNPLYRFTLTLLPPSAK